MVRKREFDNLLNPDGALVSEEARLKLVAARERLRCIVGTNEVGKNFDEEANMFDDFVAKHLERGPETSLVYKCNASSQAACVPCMRQLLFNTTW